MDSKIALYEQLKVKGLTREQERIIRFELEFDGSHEIDNQIPLSGSRSSGSTKSIYQYNDFAELQAVTAMQAPYVSRVRSLDELLERDKLREEDGFPRKIRVGRMIKPGKDSTDKVVVVPTTVEEKFLHDNTFQPPSEDESAGGSGEGDEGEVIGEQPVEEKEGEEGAGPGQGEGGAHEVESNAYDLGKILTEQFELPNLKEKGKKRSLTRYTYELTDLNRGFGQVLDKKATLKKIIRTNIALGKIPDTYAVDPGDLLISPADRVYRILSKEKDFESQAMVFFLRDYSGSMNGKPTELVVSQHVMIYSWLLYQYERQVETRFILHDTEAKEVDDFYTYYNSKVAGGTQVSSGYHFVNEIVEKENLSRDYNIYIFHGTDGDDWDTKGEHALVELKKMLTYANRIGVTIAENGYGVSGNSEVEKYLKESSLLTEYPDQIRLDVMQPDANEKRLIEGIRKMIS
ncbi:MAG: DUF444 family protein [Desulfobulbaceae bacterium]|nr:DUF444 family protein [Desulfobulbaceae bacterium]